MKLYTFMEKLHHIVCDELQIDYEKSFINTRKRIYVQARQWTMWITYTLINKTSLDDVGLFFNKDHATVLHAKKNILKFCETEKKYCEMYENLCNKARIIYKYKKYTKKKSNVYISSKKLINKIKKITSNNLDININIELNSLLSELKTRI